MAAHASVHNFQIIFILFALFFKFVDIDVFGNNLTIIPPSELLNPT
jgi:hypothetical protein